MISLEGHKALITGSTQGVGQAVALALSAAGADVVIHGLTKDDSGYRTVERCRAIGRQAELIEGDLAGDTISSVSAVYEKATSALAGIDILVNNAGGYFDVPFLDMDFARFDKTMRLNVYAYYFLAQMFARAWVAQKVRGRILLIGSINGRLAEPTHSAYDTSKGAVEMMVKTLCVELAPHGIRVNGLGPGLFRTPLTVRALDDPGTLRWMQLHTPNGMVPGAEVAGDAAVFLLSDAAAHIHGQMLLVDGGMSAWQQPNPE
jgi:NAD(P)-dependent dehydrogenase (short-subunit alcohol dehydrogenase family)